MPLLKEEVSKLLFANVIACPLEKSIGSVCSRFEVEDPSELVVLFVKLWPIDTGTVGIVGTLKDAGFVPGTRLPGRVKSSI